LLGNNGAWGQFSEAHYWSLGRSCLLNFIEIGQAVSPPGRVGDFVDKRRLGQNR